MKLKWSMITALLSILLILSACNSKELNADKEPATEPSTNAPEDVSTETDSPDINTEEPDAEETEEPEELDKPTDPEVSPDEPIIEDAENQDVDAEVVKSDNQDYQMLLLPHYTLTGEEPGKDIVYPTEDDANYMRIETLEAEEGTYDYLVENMLTILEASSDGAKPIEQTDTATFPKGNSIKNLKVFSVDSSGTPVTGLVFERDGLLVHLTIYDSKDAAYYNDFIRMAESITK